MVIMDNFIGFKPIVFKILYNLQILRFSPQFYFHYEIKKYIKKGDVVIDIGANWGCYTRLFKKWGANVIAVEPIQKFIDILKSINVKIVPCALGSGEKNIHLMHWRDTSGCYRISYEGEYQSVMIKGGVIFANLKMDFIKIDVEGFNHEELDIIEDMAELILKHKPKILIETGKINEVLSYLPRYKVIDQFRNDYLIA